MQPATREEPCEQRTKLPVWANTHKSVILTFCCVVCNANLFFTFNKTFITLKKSASSGIWKNPRPICGRGVLRQGHRLGQLEKIGSIFYAWYSLTCHQQKAPYSNGTRYQAGSQSQTFEVGGHQYLLKSRWGFIVIFWSVDVVLLHLAIPGIQQCSQHRFSTLWTLSHS